MQVRSRRLLFKEFCPWDYGLFYSVFSNERIMKYALMDAYQSPEDGHSYFGSILANNDAPPDRRWAYQFAVYEIETGTFLGFADIEVAVRNESGGSGEIGYFLLPDFWGNGYASETARALIELCFGHLGFHRVFARCNAENMPSARVMQKAGMDEEGRFRLARFKHSRWVDELHYAILKKNWTHESTIEVTP